MVDLDPQKSLVGWWKRRGRTDNPTIFEGIDTASEAVEALSLDGWDWVFIDTPPAFVHVIKDAIESCHLAVIPLRTSALDLIGSEDAVLMARSSKTPHLCVINDAETKWASTKSAQDYLLSSGVPLAKQIITHRAAYLSAMARGRVGPEVDRTNVTQAEIDALWSEILECLEAAHVEA
jgi:chromosome partitioning protein